MHIALEELSHEKQRRNEDCYGICDSNPEEGRRTYAETWRCVDI